MVELITDRTQQHVDRLKQLRSIGWHRMNASQRAEYTGYAAKGAYNYSDLNRVETAVAEIAGMLGMTLTTKTDWSLWDLPTRSEMERYLGNVRAIRDACPEVVGFPNLPDSMNHLSYEGANNIEKVLLLVYEELNSSVEPDNPEHRCVLGEFILGVCRLDGRAHTPNIPDVSGGADYIRSGEIYSGEVK